MDLSFEETMLRIKQREEEYAKKGLKRSLCREVTYPYDVDLYKGENQIIVVPTITNTGGFSVAMAWHRQIIDLENATKIGNTILEAFEHIGKSPVDARTEKEREEDSIWKNASKYKSYKSFNKNYILCGVILEENGEITISSTEKLEGNNGYGGNDKGRVYLNINASPEEIGNAVINCFIIMEEVEGNKKTGKKKRTSEIETLSNVKVSFELPDLNRYEDEQDFHSAEIYQGYSYTKPEYDEPIGKIYFGIADELDCGLSSEDILNAYVKKYGEPLQYKYVVPENTIFEYRADIIGKSIHRILYLKRMDQNELLSCELTVDIKKSGKRLDQKLVQDFEDLVNSCKIVN
ncbi:CdiI family contact-dependent growth inhibition immunity protein [bacterium]|nr:CdiI family contact-dependent growth inhibition immunity protein [bacterium]